LSGSKGTRSLDREFAGGAKREGMVTKSMVMGVGAGAGAEERKPCMRGMVVGVVVVVGRWGVMVWVW
jgi:hypothetical protein